MRRLVKKLMAVLDHILFQSLRIKLKGCLGGNIQVWTIIFPGN